MNRQESSLSLPYGGTRNVVIDGIDALYLWHVMEPYLSHIPLMPVALWMSGFRTLQFRTVTWLIAPLTCSRSVEILPTIPSKTT
jgi:hypothetical protein